MSEQQRRIDKAMSHAYDSTKPGTWEEQQARRELAEARATAAELLDVLKVIKTEMDASKRDHPRNPMSHLGYRFQWSIVDAAIARAEKGAQ